MTAELGRPDPGGDSPAAPRQDGAEEQQGEPGRGPSIQRGGEAGEPLARGGGRVRGCHDWLRPGRSAGVANPNQRNTPLVTEECEGQVTVTDPTHPLFGRTL